MHESVAASYLFQDDPTAGMGDENMSEVKAGECPVISCNPLKKPKPCPEAVPEKVIIDWQGVWI